jgi:hypothetical protein
LQLKLTAFGGTQPLRLEGRWEHPTTAPVGWFEASGQSIPVDAKLLAAIPENGQAVVRSLHPQGNVDCYVRFWRDAAEEPVRKHIIVGLNGCEICYDKFPYPLHKVTGALEMFDDSWTFSKLQGFSDTGNVTGFGHLMPTLQGNELYLRLIGADVPLDDKLRDALRPNEQQVWHILRPRGAIDLVADVKYLSEPRQLNVAIQAKTHSENSSIEPVHFPYRLEKLDASLNYRDGRVVIERFNGEHGLVKVAGGGYCDFLADGRWRLHFDGLTADRLRLDRDLTQALPERLRKSLTELRLAGPINLRGSFDLEPGKFVGDPVQTRWNVRLGLVQGSMDCGVKLENIYGTVSLIGSSDGQRFQSLGELAIDSLHYKDCQFTQVMGPIWLDERQVLLGSWVARQVNQTAGAGRESEKTRHVTARLFGGQIESDGWVALEGEPRFSLHADLSQADLSLCARELAPGQQKLRGSIAATVDLRGTGKSTNTLGGNGSIRLTNGDIYELPLMISMLKMLSIRPPDPNAFSNSDIDFRIEGEHVYFDRINFTGDAISLIGQGEMDFQQAIRLTFHSVVGRGDVNVPILKELFTGASKQIMLIHVDGTLQNPETRKDVFPGVNQALQQLQDKKA